MESADTFQRPIYAGNAIATVQSADAVKVITVRTTGFDAVATSAEEVPPAGSTMFKICRSTGRPSVTS